MPINANLLDGFLLAFNRRMIHEKNIAESQGLTLSGVCLAEDTYSALKAALQADEQNMVHDDSLTSPANIAIMGVPIFMHLSDACDLIPFYKGSK